MLPACDSPVSDSRSFMVKHVPVVRDHVLRDFKSTRAHGQMGSHVVWTAKGFECSEKDSASSQGTASLRRN